MKNKILVLLATGALLVGGYGTSAFAQTSTNTATKPDKETVDTGKTTDTTTPSPVDGSKSDKPGEATAPKSPGTDNPKTGVEPSKPGAADQTQSPK